MKFMHKKQISGFTVVELLTVMVVLGVVCSATMSLMKNISLNNNGMLFKKAFKNSSSIIEALINDKKFYPEADGFTYGNPEINFGVKTAGKIVNINGTNYSGKNKFCMAFASKANIIGDVLAGCTTTLPANNSSGTPSFTASDNSDWYFQNWEPSVNYSYIDNPTSATTGQIKKDVLNPTTIVLVDINGNKAPNCRAISYKDAKGNNPLSADFDITTAKVKDRGCKKPDRFHFTVRYDGRISFDGEVEQGYLMKSKLKK